MRTRTKESSTRKKIDIWLNNLGWDTNEDHPSCNVTTERALTEDQNKRIKPNEPDYILYQSGTENPIAVIESKRKGQTLDQAIQDALEKYARPLKIPIVLASDGTFVKTYHVNESKELIMDGEVVGELLSEDHLLRFVSEGASIDTQSPVVKQSREQLMGVFKWANGILRKEGIREGFDRFIEFANLLFLKLIYEIESDRDRKKEPRVLDEKYCWPTFANLPAETMFEYVNGTVLPYLGAKYNRSGDVFQNRLGISNPKTLKEIVDKLSRLNLINVDSDVKGDAFEYFLKHSVTVGNDLGEYFTPRHVVRLMVELINPQFGEKIYDPTCGTGGFLIHSFNHIKRTCKVTPEVLEILKEETVYGRELTNTARLAKMNMIITGDGHTNIEQTDSLEHPIEEMYDVVLANPPYAQTTEYGDLYPVLSKQADPVFLQHIMLSLKEDGRAAIIVPEGVLFRPGADKKVRELLLKKYDVNAIISLPSQTFVPYAKAKTYILIFQKGSATKKIWFFNAVNDGYSLDEKRTPIDHTDFPLLVSSWEDKEISDKSWFASYDEVMKNDFILSPWRYKPPEAPTEGISETEANTYIEELKTHFDRMDSLIKSVKIRNILSDAEKVQLSELLVQVERPIRVDPNKAYETVGVRWYGKGVFSHGEGKVKAKTLNEIKKGDFIYNKLFAWKGSFDIVGEEYDNCYASGEFPTFSAKPNRWNAEPEFIKFFFRIPSSWALANQLSKGTAKTSRNRLSVDDFLSIRIPIPSQDERMRAIELLSSLEELDSYLLKSQNMTSDLLNGLVAKIFDNLKV